MQIRKSIGSLFRVALKKFNFSKKKPRTAVPCEQKYSMRKPAELCLRMVAGLAVAARQCRCAQACKSAALHCPALQPMVAAGFMEKINASVEARCSACRDRKEKRATCGWHGMAWQPGSTEGVWLPATATAGCRRRRVSRGGGVVGWGLGREGLRRRSLPRPMGTGKQSRQRDMNARTTTDGHEARWIWPRGHPPDLDRSMRAGPGLGLR